MSKSCAFCSFKTDDEAVFAEHAFVVHGWGKPRAGTTTDELTSNGATYCYGCATPNPPNRAKCASCGAHLALAESGRRFGQVYALNHVEVLLRSGFIDEATAARLRLHYRGALGLTSAPPATAVTQAPREPPPSYLPPEPAEDATEEVQRRVVSRAPLAPSAPSGPGLFSPERAPSLLLYVGAFLIVVAALIFVNVSGEQISGEVKLSLLIIGTIGFIGVGLFCYRSPRVLEAGTTFLMIGALLLPLDFVAYHVLITGRTLSGSMIWTLGSFASAGLYATLAASGFGRLYSYLFLPAALSAAAGLESVLAIDDAWIFLPIAFVPLLLTLAGAVLHDVRVQRITSPLERAGGILATITLSMSAAIVPIFETVGAEDRRVVPVTFVVAAIYYSLRARTGGGLDRWRAALGPAAVIVSIVYLLHGVTQTYGFAFALIAIAYAIAADGLLLGSPVHLPPWLVRACERIALGSAGLAVLPVAAYWTAPFVGAVVDLTMSIGLAAVCVRRAATRVPLLRGLLVASAILLHIGVALLLIGFGVVHAGTRPYTDFVAREVALAFAPLSAFLGAAAWVSRTRLPQVKRDLALIALGSAVTTLVFAYTDPFLATIFGLAVGVAIVGAARAARVPDILWFGAAAFGYALVAADRWLSPPHELRPVALSLVAVGVFAPAALRQWRALAYAPVLRQIGLASAASAMIVGLISLATPLRPEVDPVGLATVPSVLVYGAIGVADGLLRRSEEEILGSTAFFLVAALMLIARADPAQLEAYTVPVALYLALVAWGLAHWDMAPRASLEMPVRVAAALALALPTYALSWRDGDATRGIIVLAEGALILAVATWLADVELGWIGVGFLGLMLARGIAAPLVFESATAAFGALVIAVGLAARRTARWRTLARIHEPAELIASLLIVLPPLSRATARGSDALDQGASALAIAVILVAVALWSGRRMLLASGVGAAAAVGVLAIPDSARAEPYVAGAGIALLVLALLVGRVFPARFPASYVSALEVTAAALLLSGAAQRTFVSGGDAATRLAVESIVVSGLGLFFARPAVSYVGAASTALVGIWVIGDVNNRELHATLTGAALILISLYALRYASKVLDPRALLAIEAGGALLFIGPTLIAGWREGFFPRTPMVFLEIFLVFGVGLVLRRRWLIGGALGALGLEAVRALIDVVNRLPNYVLFAASGALLLAIGFVLLLKREAWRDWSQRATAWWTRL